MKKKKKTNEKKKRSIKFTNTAKKREKKHDI
jgi:hypothetical protein